MNKLEINKLYLNYSLKSIKKPVIHFITYANIVFENAKKRILKEASYFNEFETITGYGPENIPALVREKYSNILEHNSLYSGGVV